MAKYESIPEGVYTFKIVSSSYDEENKKIHFKMVTVEENYKYYMSINILDKDGVPSSRAIRFALYIVKACFRIWDMNVLDSDDIPALIGKCFSARVKPKTFKLYDGRTMIRMGLCDITSANRLECDV